MLKAAQNGRPVNMAELPPQVATGLYAIRVHPLHRSQ